MVKPSVSVHGYAILCDCSWPCGLKYQQVMCSASVSDDASLISDVLLH